MFSATDAFAICLDCISPAILCPKNSIGKRSIFHINFAFPALAILPFSFSEYNDIGDLVGKVTYTNGWEGAEETYAYDSYGNCISKVDALGNETTFEFDAVGNLVSEGGATYPVRYEYDSQGRRVAMLTNRSGDVWDVTRWSFYT